MAHWLSSYSSVQSATIHYAGTHRVVLVACCSQLEGDRLDQAIMLIAQMKCVKACPCCLIVIVVTLWSAKCNDVVTAHRPRQVIRAYVGGRLLTALFPESEIRAYAVKACAAFPASC